MFTKNEGALDRGVRLVLGVVLALLAIFSLSGGWAWVAGIVAAILLVTAAIGFCPLYTLVHVNTGTGRAAPRR